MAHLKLKKKKYLPLNWGQAIWGLLAAGLPFPLQWEAGPSSLSPGAWLSDARDAQTRLLGHGESCRGQALRQGGGQSERLVTLVTRTCGVRELPLQDGAHSAEGWRGLSSCSLPGLIRAWWGPRDGPRASQLPRPCASQCSVTSFLFCDPIVS